MSSENESRDRLYEKISELQEKQSENKYELIKEIHRVKDNSFRNLAAIITVIAAVTGYLGWEYLIPEAVNNEISKQANEAVTELGKKIAGAIEIEKSLSSPLIVFVSDHGDSDPLVGTLYKSSPRARIHVTPKPNEFNRLSGLHASWSLLKLSQRFPNRTIFVSPANPGDPTNDFVFLQVLDTREPAQLEYRFPNRESDTTGVRTLFFVGYDSGTMDLIQNYEAFEVQEYRRIITPESIDRKEFEEYRRMKLVEIIQGISAFEKPRIPEPSAQVGRKRLGFGAFENRLVGSKDYWYEPEFDGTRFTGVVLEVDDFGNITTNLKESEVASSLGLRYGDRIEIADAQGNTHEFTFGPNYEAVPRGSNVCIPIDEYLQLAISYGNLEAVLHWKPEHTIYLSKP